MKVLALGAHPDDVEIFMYGLLSICKSRGDEIFIAIATDGGAGSVLTKENLIETRKKETKKGLYFLTDPYLMNFSDGYLISEPNAFSTIKNYILQVNPNLIVTHDPNDYHSDHRILSKMVTNAASFLCPVIFCDTLLGVNFSPDFYINISSIFEEKKRAILCHKSQNPGKFIDAITIQNSFRSAQCNLGMGNYAECYRYEKRFPFSDISSLLPKTIENIPYYKNIKNALI